MTDVKIGRASEMTLGDPGLTEGNRGSSSALCRYQPIREKGKHMKRYEKPRLTAAGSFRKVTGLLQFRGNDRLLLSKN
ncbi:hypothetical protein GCM10010156_20340 [Planobispora rosea]|uniref:Uncharacterized protein n=1 Tax=Planobispora rosea TaxID=35762 RepID=A0A8J3WF59_PLARO|nr:keywimysin-related RiPP [Planobispora rosea]GGS61624.1 hypothetical protein GCM10010156_20340 [Planobispora rosea]GIH86537.1 hypothetical protein Pro02_49450 [Planobispora rosea]